MNNVEQAKHAAGCDCQDCWFLEQWGEKCAKAGLTPEQTAQVLDFRLDPWWCNADAQAENVIDFFHRQNDQQFEAYAASLNDMSDPAFNSHPAALR